MSGQSGPGGTLHFKGGSRRGGSVPSHMLETHPLETVFSLFLCAVRAEDFRVEHVWEIVISKEKEMFLTTKEPLL